MERVARIIRAGMAVTYFSPASFFPFLLSLFPLFASARAGNPLKGSSTLDVVLLRRYRRALLRGQRS